MTAAPRQPLTLVWRRQVLEAVLEGSFIREVLLGALGRPVRTVVVEPGAAMPVIDDALYVSFGVDLAEHLPTLRAKGCVNVGLLHMADEHGTHDRGFYRDADYVLRHYWFEAAMASPHPASLGVLWVPNGYGNAVGPVSAQTMPGAAERHIMGFFSGSLDARTLTDERKRMVQAIRDAKLPFLVGGTPGFGLGLKPVTYAAYLSATRFGLVPGGNSPETIRLYEVLEAGAIPVMLRSAFVSAPDALDNPPFVLLDDWSELAQAWAPYADADAPAVVDALEARRREVYAWWCAFKQRQQRRVAALIDESFARVYDD